MKGFPVFICVVFVIVRSFAQGQDITGGLKGDLPIENVDNSLPLTSDLISEHVPELLIDPNIQFDDPNVNENLEEAGKKRLSLQLFAIVEHFKQEDPVGLPDVPIPDPMDIIDIKKAFSVGTLHMKDVKMYGLSKFRIKYVKTDLKELQVNAGIQVDELQMIGNYTLSSFFSKSSGPFTVLIKDVFVEGNGTLGVERDGKIKTQDIQMDIKFEDMSMNFENLGFMGSIFQGIANSASNLVFETVKPFMMKESYQQIRTEIDSNLENVIADRRFPNSISPLDMLIAEGRKQVRNMGYDPYQVKDYNNSVGIFGVQMTHTWIEGVSSFYRVGNISVTMINNTVIAGMQVGTKEVRGTTQWEVNVGGGMVTRAGHVKFTVQHIKVAFELSQSLDLRNRAKLQDLQLELGNIQVRCDGAGTLDYVLEAVVNILPNLLRYQIMDALENPIKTRVNEILSKIDVETILKEKVVQYERDGNINLDLNFL